MKTSIVQFTRDAEKIERMILREIELRKKGIEKNNCSMCYYSFNCKIRLDHPCDLTDCELYIESQT